VSDIALDDDPFEGFDDSIAGDVRDPYPALAEARRDTPVMLQEPEFEGQAPGFLVFPFDLVSQVLRDGETFSSAVLRDVMGPVMGDYIILGMDEPEHRRHRALVGTAFRQKVLARWEIGLVQRVVDELVDRIVARGGGSAELVRDFTFRFPVQVIAGVLGLPRQDYAQFQKWASAIISVNSQWDRGIEASVALKGYLSQVLAERRVSPGEDLISDLAVTELDGEMLDDEEIFSFLRLILPAGAETTFRSSGNLLYALLTNTDQLDAVRADRSLLPQAIEEGLRWEPPLLITTRVAAKDTSLGGFDVPAGAGVTVSLGAANRDPARYPDPDRFDIFRDPKQHISFGYGPHMCLGMHLARMETRVALDTLFTRLPDLRLDLTGDDPHIHGEIFRSPTSLPVRLLPPVTGPRGR
jgi:cytochrome P450